MVHLTYSRDYDEVVAQVQLPVRNMASIETQANSHNGKNSKRDGHAQHGLLVTSDDGERDSHDGHDRV